MHPREHAITRPIRPDTLASVGARRLLALAAPFGRAHDVPRLRAMLELLLGDGARRSPHEDPAFGSDVGDDHTPFELSVSLGATTDLRVLAEPQARGPSLVANRDAALRVLRALEERGIASLDRFAAIADLFLPDTPEGAFTIWIALGGTELAPDAKVYLCPEARGRALAPALVEEALCRLGLARAWPALARTLLARGPELDELKYVALDLDRGPDARVKIYARHHDATIDEAEHAASAAREHVRGDVASLLRTVGARRRFDGRPLATCLAYTAADPVRPASATTYVPVNDYAPDDRAVVERVSALLEHHGIDARAYREASRAYARRPLEEGIGTQSYVALKRRRGAPVVTVYFAAEAYRPGTIARVPIPAPARTTRALAERVEARAIDVHPFWRRVEREPVSPGVIALLLESARVALTTGLAPRVATTIARIEDPAIRSRLAALLDDELGRGDPARAHDVFFARMDAAFAPFALPLDEDVRLAPARALAAALDAIHLDRPAYEGLGALLLSERYGEQVDAAMARLLARQREVGPEHLAFMAMHRELEEEHAAGTLSLLETVAPGHVAEVERGVRALERATLRFFDALHELCAETVWGRP